MIVEAEVIQKWGNRLNIAFQSILILIAAGCLVRLYKEQGLKSDIKAGAPIVFDRVLYKCEALK